MKESTVDPTVVCRPVDTVFDCSDGAQLCGYDKTHRMGCGLDDAEVTAHGDAAIRADPPAARVVIVRAR